MGFEKGNPFEKLVLGDFKSFAELFDGVKSCKEFPEDAQDKEQTVAGVRDDDIRKDGMCMVTAVTEDPEDAEIRFFLSAGLEVDDGSAVVVMDVAVSFASTGGTGLQTGLKFSHVGIKKRF